MVVVFAVITASGVGSYLATSASNPGTTFVNHGDGVFHLSLVEIMNTQWNSTMAQPEFYVMGPKGLESSANIILPAKTLIEISIVSYDTPTPGSSDEMGVVNGTVNGDVYLINGTMASMNSMPGQWGMNVTQVAGSDLAHTLTIPQLGVNLPVVGGDTEIAYVYLTKSGTFTWYCETPCGFGPTGMDGAMSKTGWMAGQITVQ